MLDLSRHLEKTQGYFSQRVDIPAEKLGTVEGVKKQGHVEVRKLRVGDEILMLHVYRKEGLIDPIHKHMDHESTSYLINSKLRLVIGDRRGRAGLCAGSLAVDTENREPDYCANGLFCHWGNEDMTDALGWRKKFGVLIPSTNTSVQPEFDKMAPDGVTNHISRIRIPNIALNSDADFQKLIELIAEAQNEAVDSVMSCAPDVLVLGISAETFWGGYAASTKLREDLAAQTGLPVAIGSDACQAALTLFGAKRIGVITPYQPVGDRNVVRFFQEAGFEVPRITGLKCESPVAIAHVGEDRLRAAVAEIDGDDVDVIVQVGTNLAMARLAPTFEAERGKPVIAINTAIYWDALRRNGIDDKVMGFGPLLEKH
jgi:maleate isomerase